MSDEKAIQDHHWGTVDVMYKQKGYYPIKNSTETNSQSTGDLQYITTIKNQIEASLFIIILLVRSIY